MKLVPASRKRQETNPFKSIMEHVDSTSPPQTGAGIGLDRQRPGLGKPKSAKRRRWDAEVLGETPQRDGPFQFSAGPIAKMFPTRRRVDPRKKQSGVDPFGTLDIKLPRR